MDAIAANATPITGAGIPGGPQNILVLYSGEGFVQIPGPTGGTFNVYFVYEVGQAPATVVQLYYNGQSLPYKPGQYQLYNINSGLGIYYQLGANQSIKLVWIYN